MDFNKVQGYGDLHVLQEWLRNKTLDQDGCLHGFHLVMRSHLDLDGQCL